jgi:hypothetical protein
MMHDASDGKASSILRVVEGGISREASRFASRDRQTGKTPRRSNAVAARRFY